MSNQIWRVLYPVIVRESRAMGRRARRATYSDRLIVAMFFWMVLHDRTQQWACDRLSYHGPFRPRALPSPSRFSRRLRSERCRQLLKRVVEAFRGSPQAGYYFLDSRPLTIGACSKDPDGLVETADEYNDPGKFTAFIGYEWTSMPDGGNNLHRVVIFKGDASEAGQVVPFSAFDSEDPEGLWAYFEDYETKTGGKVLALAHNGNVSNCIANQYAWTP